jgi:hypothetical protein
MSVAAYGQNNVATGLPSGVAVQSGAAILDSARPGPPVHPGTAIVDSMGIYAGLPAPNTANGSAIATRTLTPK